jgi:hypothetical protein
MAVLGLLSWRGGVSAGKAYPAQEGRT